MVFDLIGPLREEEMAMPLLFKEWHKNGGMGERRLLDHPPLPCGEDVLNRVDELFPARSHVNTKTYLSPFPLE